MLSAKVALVTGSTSGIGLGIAKRLAKNGASIVLNGFGAPEEIARLVSGIKAEYGVPCVHHPADMADKRQIQNMMAATKESMGPVSILVNNCGIQHVSPIESFEDDMWDKVLALNLSSNFHTIKHALADMRESQFGRIINIASVHGQVASPHKSAYVASKHAVIGLTKTVALETAENKGVTCNAVCPGWVLTPLVQAQIEARMAANGTSFETESQELLAEKQPSRTFVRTEDIGDLCVFLSSPAAEQITGQAMAVDGGWTAV